MVSQLAKDLAIKKIASLEPELMKLRLFPEAKKKEIYERLVEGRDIKPLPVNTVIIPIEIQEMLDSEYQIEFDELINRIQRLKEVATSIVESP